MRGYFFGAVCASSVLLGLQSQAGAYHVMQASNGTHLLTPELSAKIITRLEELGYSVEEPLSTVHSLPEEFEWKDNGYAQTYCTVEGERRRILYYFPGQVVQPHVHDRDAKFEVMYGSIYVTTWSPTDPENHHLKLSEPSKTSQFSTGEIVTIPGGVPHRAEADGEKGAVVHEWAGDFEARTTVFASIWPNGDSR